MPSAKKVAWAQLKVGVVTVAALVLLGILLFLITGERTLFSPQAPLYTYMEDSVALTRSSEVRLNGILAGKVQRVVLSGLSEPRREVRVEMAVDSAMLAQIPEDSVAGIAAQNVLGIKYINIKRGRSRTAIKAGGTLASRDTSEIQEVVESSYALLTSMKGMLERVDRIISAVESGQGSIGKLIYDKQLYENLNGTAVEARKIVEQLNSGKGSVSRLFYDDGLYDDMRGTVARMNTLLDGLQQGQGTLGRLLKDQALYDDFRKTVAEFRTLAADLNAGKGTAGKFLKDEALHKQIQATIARMDTLIDKINQGQGTLGQLVVNPQLYESLNGTAREIHEFMKDFRKNPKKFLSIKLGLF